jgi:hypothetical protein
LSFLTERLNKGTFQKSLGFDTGIAPDFINTGTAKFLSGTVIFSGNYKQTTGTTTINGGGIQTSKALDIEAGLLEGVGAITGDVSNVGGTVHPGLGNAPGTLNIFGNFTQGAGGTLVIDFGASGTAYGVLDVQTDPIQGRGGTATLGGTLTVNRNGFQSDHGSFTFITWNAVVGDFASTNLGRDTWTLPNGVSYAFWRDRTQTNSYTVFIAPIV